MQDTTQKDAQVAKFIAKVTGKVGETSEKHQDVSSLEELVPWELELDAKKELDGGRRFSQHETEIIDKATKRLRSNAVIREIIEALWQRAKIAKIKNCLTTIPGSNCGTSSETLLKKENNL